MTRFLNILAVSLGIYGVAHAQTYTNVIEGGTTVTITNNWNNGGNELIVGGTSGGNLLDITRGNAVSNSSQVVVGRDAGADGNTINLDGSGLLVNGDIYVGMDGDNNQMVLDESIVTNKNAYVGQNGDGNSVTVTDQSVWINEGTLYLNGGSGNSVTVSDRAEVQADKLELSAGNEFNLNDSGVLLLRGDFNASTNGFNWNDGGYLYITNGTLTGLTPTNGVSYLDGGRGLTLNDSSMNVGTNKLVVGLGDSGSQLQIINGAVVESGDGAIGANEGGSNLIEVGGTNSAWRVNGGQLDLGAGGGAGNQLRVSDAAWVTVGDASEADVNATTNGGMVVAGTSGAGLMLDNSSFASLSGDLFVGTTNGHSGSVTIQSNSTLNVGNLTIEDASSSVELLETGSLAVDGDFAYGNDSRFTWQNNTTLSVGGKLSKTNGLDGIGRTLVLNGGDWGLGDANVVSGLSNTVEVAFGATLNTTNAFVSGSNNTVAVYGSGSHWDNDGTITATGTNNLVEIASGGQITADSIAIGDGNDLNIDDGGTLALNTNLFDWSAQENVNWNGGGTIEVIGGVVQGLDATNLVYNGSTNSITTFGNGRGLALNNSSLDASSGDLVIGLNQDGESHTISNGSSTVNQDGYIGWGSGSEGNSVTVKDSGSLWQNLGGNLSVGAYYKTGETNLTRTGGGFNRLFVRAGAQVFVGDATTTNAGMLVAATNGATFTVWDGQVEIDDTLYIGQGSLTGHVEIAKGGDVRVGDLEIDQGILDLQADSKFRIGSDLDLTEWATNGFVWYSTNSTLQVDGEFTHTQNFLDKEQNLILGTNGVWDLSGSNLIVGVDGSSTLTMRNSGDLVAVNIAIGGNGTNSGSNAIIVENADSTLTANNLTIGEFNDDNYLQVLDEGFVDLLGSLSIGGTNSSGNYVLVNGSNTLMNVFLDVSVGSSDTNSSGNILYIQDAATLDVGGSLSVYGGNSVVFSGATNTVGGNFTVSSNAVVSGTGEVTLNNANAVLTFEDGNMAIVDDVLTYMVSTGVLFNATGSNDINVNGGIFGVLGSTSDQFTGFDTLAINDGVLYGHGTNSFANVNMTNGTIRPTSILGAVPVSGGSNTLIDAAGTLVFTGNFNASNTVYEAGVLGTSGTDLLDFEQAVTLDGLIANITVLSATNSTNIILTSDIALNGDFAETNIVNNLLLYDVSVAKNGNDFEVVLTNTTDAFSSSLDYAGTESVRAGFNGMKNAVFTRTKQLRRNLVSTAHAMPHDAFLMTNTNAPVGPQGPGADNTIFDMHVWAQYFNGQGEYDAHGNSYGYDLNNSGTTFGADKLVGEDLTLGFNYTYVRGDAKTTNADYLDNETYWIGGYGEWVSQGGLYVDGLLAYGRSTYDSVRVETRGDRDYRGTASYRGSNFGGYVDVGQYLYYKNLSIAPYLGLHTLFISTDDHTETSVNDANDKIKVSGLSRNLVESALGMKMRHRFDTGIGRFQTTGYAEWTHDFVQDEIATEMQATDILGLTSAPITQAAIKPEQDIFNVGLGFSWRSTDYMEIGIGYNGRFSKDYEEHSGSLMLDLMF